MYDVNQVIYCFISLVSMFISNSSSRAVASDAERTEAAEAQMLERQGQLLQLGWFPDLMKAV